MKLLLKSFLRVFSAVSISAFFVIGAAGCSPISAEASQDTATASASTEVTASATVPATPLPSASVMPSAAVREQPSPSVTETQKAQGSSEKAGSKKTSTEHSGNNGGTGNAEDSEPQDVVTPAPEVQAPNPVPAATPEMTPAPTPKPEPTEPPKQGGQAHCSCGAVLSPSEIAAHMKQHALNGESCSYKTY